jgi:hypothetical protein
MTLKLILPLLLFASSLFSQTAWSPYERVLWIQPSTFQSEYMNPFLPSPYRINLFQTAIQYGISDKLTFDLTIGYGKIQKISNYYPFAGVVQENSDTTKHGFIDSRIGLRYKFLDEMESKYDWMPTLSLRLGRIQKGDYDRRPQSLGDGASGAEINLYLAKDFNFYGFGTFGEVGYRKRERPVPMDQIYSLSLYKTFFENIYIIAGYRGQKTLGGFSYSDPSQNESQTPTPETSNSTQTTNLENRITNKWLSEERPDWARRENYLRNELSLAYRDSYGNFYTLYYSKTVQVENSPLLETFGLLANFSFYL